MFGAIENSADLLQRQYNAQGAVCSAPFILYISDMYTIGAVYAGADHGVRCGYSFSEGLDVGLVSSMGQIG
jgi:hypothetical protein